MEPTNTLILIVDDNAFNREGITKFFSLAGYNTIEAGNYKEALAVACESVIHAAIIDLAIPESPGGEANQELGFKLAWGLKEKYPLAGVVIFSAYGHYMAEFSKKINEGMRGIAYMLKGCRPSALQNALRDVILGHVVIGREVKELCPFTPGPADNDLSPTEKPYVESAAVAIEMLTPRQRTVVRLLTESLTTGGVADALRVSQKTVENYICQIYQTLGLSDLNGSHDSGHYLRKSAVLVKAWQLHAHSIRTK